MASRARVFANIGIQCPTRLCHHIGGGLCGQISTLQHSERGAVVGVVLKQFVNARAGTSDHLQWVEHHLMHLGDIIRPTFLANINTLSKQSIHEDI
jgi:hypothetical protein